MIIIGLRGPNNSGKTRALQLLILKIIDTYSLANFFVGEKDLYELKSKGELLTANKTPKDISVIFEINGIKVGVTTMGDDHKDVAEILSQFKSSGCEIAVCACHKWRDKALSNIAHIGNLEGFIEKNRENDPKNYETASKTKCDEVYDRLNEELRKIQSNYKGQKGNNVL